MLGVFSATISSVSWRDCAFDGENTAGAAIDVARALDDARKVRRFMMLISPIAPTGPATQAARTCQQFSYESRG